MLAEWHCLRGHPDIQGQRLQDCMHLGSLVGSPQAQGSPLADLGRRRPEPEEVSELGQFTGALCLARLCVFDRLVWRALRDGDRHGDQKFYGSTPSQAGVIGVRSERHHLICPPHAKRHGGEDFLELVRVVGGEQSERAPFSWPQGTGVSRQTLHTWIARYERGGLSSLADRSHRPDTCPHQTGAEVEAAICELRREHPGWGPRRIEHHLARSGVDPVPSRSSIYRCLRRHGLVELRRRRKRPDIWVSSCAETARSSPQGDGCSLGAVLRRPHPRYRANDRRTIRRLASAGRFRVASLALIEPQPTYLFFHPLAFRAGVAYQRIVSGSERLAGLRCVIVGELEAQ
jgi:transposase